MARAFVDQPLLVVHAEPSDLTSRVRQRRYGVRAEPSLMVSSGLASVVRRRRWCRCGAVIDGVRVRLLSAAVAAAALEPLSTASGLLGAAMKEPTYHGWKSAWLADALVVLHACTYIQAHLYSYMCSDAASG